MSKELSRRQRECLELSATLHDDEIATRLGISVHTVRKYIGEARQRLGVQDRKAARRILPQSEGGAKEGLPNPEPETPEIDLSGIRSDDTDPETVRGCFARLPPPPSILIRIVIMVVVAVVVATALNGVIGVMRGTLQETATLAPANGS